MKKILILSAFSALMIAPVAEMHNRVEKTKKKMHLLWLRLN
jgi:hypothetical protein